MLRTERPKTVTVFFPAEPTRGCVAPTPLGPPAPRLPAALRPDPRAFSSDPLVRSAARTHAGQFPPSRPTPVPLLGRNAPLRPTVRPGVPL